MKCFGFMLFRYFELKQIPNFILAAPVLYILSTECATFFKASVSKFSFVMPFVRFNNCPELISKGF